MSTVRTLGGVDSARKLAIRPKGTGTLAYERGPDETGEYVARLPGPHRVTVARGPDRAKVLGALESAVRDLRGGEADAHGATRSTELRAWAALVLDDQERDASERSRAKHITTDALGRLPLGLVTKPAVRDWLVRLQSKRGARGEPLARQTAHNTLVLLRVVLGQAVDAGILETNPAAGLRLSFFWRGTTRPPGTVIPSQLIDALLATEALSTRERAIVVFALTTGLRWGELRAATLDDIDPDGGAMLVRFAGPGKPTKSGRPRRVPLSALPLGALRAELDERGIAPPFRPGELLFPRPEGGMRSRPPVEALRRACNAIGFTRPLRWHDLRHTAATGLLRGWWAAPLEVREVQRAMGHADLRTTERYLHD